MRYLWIFFLLLSRADWISFRLAIWLFAAFTLLALRKYFSLVEIRLQDRWGQSFPGHRGSFSAHLARSH